MVLIATNYIDDGAVFYLNGSEVGRLRVRPGENHSTLADNQVNEGVPEVLFFDAARLINGDNVLAVEVHQSSQSSADIVFGNSLVARPLMTFVVSASTAGGGTVAMTPAAASYRSNSLVTLSATPWPGWTFLQWLGDASGTSETRTVRVGDRDLCVQALFGTTLGTSVSGNGLVITDPAVPHYPYGTMVRLTAMPQPGNYFDAWGNAVMTTTNPMFFPVTNATPTVSCAFGPLSAGQVALTVLTEGRGRVRTSPGDNQFPSGQTVSLTAIAEPGQEFLGWSGDASGSSTNHLTMLTESKVITANFTRRPRLLLGPCQGGWREAGFQLALTGEFDARYRVERSNQWTNWSTLASFTNIWGISQAIDATASEDATRIYRAVEEP